MTDARADRRAFVALGANLGDARATLERAAIDLDAIAGVRVTRVADPVRTAPVGGPPGQPDYWNGALELVTTRTPESLLVALQHVELAHGRVRAERNGPRTLDLDLLWFEGERRDAPDLELPHPRMEDRAFVLVPLARIAPDFVLPRCGTTVRARALELTRAAGRPGNGTNARAARREQPA